jgi:hypothetical protein
VPEPQVDESTMSDAARYAALLAGAAATIAYTVRARRRIRSGRGHGLYSPKVTGTLGVLILCVVGFVVGFIVEFGLVRR